MRCEAKLHRPPERVTHKVRGRRRSEEAVGWLSYKNTSFSFRLWPPSCQSQLLPWRPCSGRGQME